MPTKNTTSTLPKGNKKDVKKPDNETPTKVVKKTGKKIAEEVKEPIIEEVKEPIIEEVKEEPTEEKVVELEDDEEDCGSEEGEGTDEVVEQVNPKKRGRKPKQAEPDVDISKSNVPKKRGRRPKDKTYTVISNYKEVPVEVQDDNIILHLPVAVPEIADENDDKIETNGVLKYNPNLFEPMPYEPMNSMISGFAMITDKNADKNAENLETDIERRFEEKVEIAAPKCNNDELYVRDIGFEEDNKDYFRVLKKAKILKLIENDDNRKDWDLSTDTCCFYCTEKFQTVPIGIPVRYFRGKFFCRDIFCSFNCAAAYIFSGFDMRYNCKKWEYYSLLCLLASKIKKEIDEEMLKNGEQVIEKKNQSIKVKIAESRNLLKKFGGPLSIDQFRSNFYVLDSQYSILYPPLSCMYPQTEVAHYVNIHRQKAQILNMENRYSLGDNRNALGDLRLKRDKPLIQKKNTLEEYMSLKIN